MRLADFIFAARPMLLLPVWSIYLITCKFSYGQSPFDLKALLSIIAVSLVAAGAYLINQIFDYQTDLINKKLGFLQHGLINRSEMTAAYISVSVIGLMAGFAAGFMTGIIVFMLTALGFFYSASLLRLKDRPVWGALANAVGYGFLLPPVVPGFMDHFTATAASLSVYFFFAVLAVYLLTVIPDREGDRASGKRTIAVLFSDRPIILMASVLLCLTIAVAYAFGHRDLLIVSIVSLCLSLTALISPGTRIVPLACKMPVLLLTILAGLYYPTYLIFVLVLVILTRVYYRKRFGMKYPRFA